MTTKKAPFNIKFISDSRITSLGGLPVTSTDIFNTAGDFHPQGLYSNEIFGIKGSAERQRKNSFIDIKLSVLHPKFAIELFFIKILYRGILSGTTYAVWDSKIKDFVKSDIIDGQTGYNFFITHLSEIALVKNNSAIRELRIDFINKHLSEAMYDKVMVIPAGIRDIEVGEDGTVEDEINTIYRKLIRIANVVPVTSTVKDLSSLDTMRWKLQLAFIELYKHIEAIVAGKRGFARGKFASRNTSGGTRNVITAMDPAPDRLGSPTAVTVHDTIVGLQQYMMGTKDMSIHAIKTGYMSGILATISSGIPVLERGTWTPTTINPSREVIALWGTDEGLETLINTFNKEDIKDDILLIDNYLPFLIYNKDDKIAVVHNPDLLSKEDRQYLREPTIGEYYYLTVYKNAEKSIMYITRYPTTGTGSIYPSKTYLRSTVINKTYYELNSDLSAMDGFNLLKAYPVVGSAAFQSLSVHTSKVKALGADHDGDMTSNPIVVSNEAMEEGTKYLQSKSSFLSPEGGLNFGVTGSVSNLVLHNLTKDL